MDDLESRDGVLICPDCSEEMAGLEYDRSRPEHYDGVSEWVCLSCGLRIGRWSLRRLGPGEIEPRLGGAFVRLSA